MFKFSLQRVLELKARREQAVAIQVARLRADADDAREEWEGLEAVRAEGAIRGSEGRLPTVGEMQNAGFVLLRLDERIEQAQTLVQEAEARVAEGEGELMSASQERRVLDRLRERHLTAWQTEQVQMDLKTMDTIALSRFTQAGATTEPEGE
jgi:flagellar FliJ protein